MWDTLITLTNTEEHEHVQCLLSHTEIRPHNKKLKHNHRNSGQSGHNFSFSFDFECPNNCNCNHTVFQPLHSLESPTFKSGPEAL